MIRVHGQEEMEAWLLDRIPGEGTVIDMMCTGKVINEELVAVAGYYNYNKESGTICFNLAGREGKLWLTRDFLWYMFYYPFVELGVNILFGTVFAENKKVISLAIKLGFRVLETQKIKGKDVHVIYLFREDCKYLEPPKEVKIWVS